MSHKRIMKEERRLNVRIRRGIIAFCVTGITLISCILYELYGPPDEFRDLLITTAMTTMNHQYLAKWFYSDTTINKVLSKNSIIEVDEDVDTSVIQDNNTDNNVYVDEYDKAILQREPGNNLYKVIKLSTKNYKGFLVAIYDPSRIKITTSRYLGVKGESLPSLAGNNDAVVAINGSGFLDLNERGTGGQPTGSIVKNGKVVWRSPRGMSYGGVIGFNYHNQLILTKEPIDTAITKYDLRDAVEFGPFLIINGTQFHVKGNGGWGIAPRTAIGQRKDGIVLLLVVDGRQPLYSIGAQLGELTDIMARYKAYNAANLDGGASSALVINGLVQNRPTAVVKGQLRLLPNAWIVTK